MNQVSLTLLTDADFDDELSRRINRVQSAWNALQASLAPNLEGAAAPPASVAHGAAALWREMEASEAALEEGWRELARRKHRRLGG